MRPADVLEPILAPVCNYPEHPCIEATANLREVLVRFDEAQLQDVFRDIRTPRHAQRMAVERITIALNQSLERVSISTENALNNQLICVIQINRALISPRG